MEFLRPYGSQARLAGGRQVQGRSRRRRMSPGISSDGGKWLAAQQLSELHSHHWRLSDFHARTGLGAKDRLAKWQRKREGALAAGRRRRLYSESERSEPLVLLSARCRLRADRIEPHFHSG